MVKFWVGFALLVAAIGVFTHWDGPSLGGNWFSFGGDSDSEERTRGSGVAASEARTVEDFSRIHAEGASVIEVEVKDGLARTVEIKADDNLLRLIDTEVIDGVLEISPSASFSPLGDVQVKITTPSLAGVHLEGANRLRLVIDSKADLEVHIEGAGRVHASGRIGKMTIHSEGAGSIDAAELIARAVDVWIEGAGRATVNATESLKAQIEGAGYVRYGGNPARVEKNVDGIGHISRID